MTSRIRQGARGLVLDEDDNVLLVHFDWDGQSDTWYLVRTTHFDPQPQVVLSDENVHGVRWFTRSELEQPNVSFSPRDLAIQLETVLANGVPPVAPEIECLT